MPITNTDLVLYVSANHPVNDSTTSGGAIDTTRRPEFTQFVAPAVVALVSDGVDTRVATVVMRNAAGTIVSEPVILAGPLEVTTVAVAERLLSVTLDSTSASRTVTIKEGASGTTRATLPINEIGITSTFIASASAASAVNRHEKLFWKNNHTSLTLNSAEITLTADPAARIKIGVCAAKNDSTSVANRLAAPGGISFVDDNVTVAVPTGSLAAGDRIGFWVRQELQASDAPFKSTYQTRLSGVSA